MLRYSLGSLFLVLLYLSVGCAALVNASGIWPQVAITLTITILVLFSLGAIFWTERRRVFAIGFAATGWLYFLLLFSDVTNVRPYLLTETAMNRLFITMHGDQATPIGLVYRSVVPSSRPPGVQRAVYATPLPPPGLVTSSSNTPAPVYSSTGVQPITLGLTYTAVAVQPTVDSRSFVNIGHSMWAVIVAFVGGVTAQLLARRRKQVAKSPGKAPV